MPKEKEMSFLDHVEELRRRIINSLIAILIFSIVAYFFSERIIDFLAKPVSQVYFMSPTEAFSIRIKLSIILGIFAASPVIFYQLWKFVVPGLIDKERKIILPAVLFSTFFFLVGASFCFFLVLPTGIKILLGFGTEKLTPLLRIGDYISFIAYMTLAFGAVFELPVISYFLGKLGIISSRTLAKGRRFAIVAILILAAALTPGPDVFSQLMLAVPLYTLYEASIFVLKVTQKKKVENA
jgi:sec-independent protein translocase protein TatC